LHHARHRFAAHLLDLGDELARHRLELGDVLRSLDAQRVAVAAEQAERLAQQRVQAVVELGVAQAGAALRQAAGIERDEGADVLGQP